MKNKLIYHHFIRMNHFKEFGFESRIDIDPGKLIMMNRPTYYIENSDKDELEHYNLQTIAYKPRGMGHYSIIGVRDNLYYYLHLGGSSWYESITQHLHAQHYCHDPKNGQTLDELKSLLRDDIDCWGFPKQKTKIKILDYYMNTEGEKECFICSFLKQE